MVTGFLILALNFRSKFPSTAQDSGRCTPNRIYLKPVKSAHTQININY